MDFGPLAMDFGPLAIDFCPLAMDFGPEALTFKMTRPSEPCNILNKMLFTNLPNANKNNTKSSLLCKYI